jgi:hypothetical protein
VLRVTYTAAEPIEVIYALWATIPINLLWKIISPVAAPPKPTELHDVIAQITI